MRTCAHSQAPLDSVMPEGEGVTSAKEGLFAQILNTIFKGGPKKDSGKEDTADASDGAFDSFDYVSPTLRSGVGVGSPR